MDLPKIPDKNIVTMDKSQVQRILAAVNDTAGMSEGEILRHSKIIKRDHAIMMLFFGTGIRVSELVGIDISDIDFYNASLLITRKGGDEDEVYFGSEVQEALEDYVLADREALLAGKDDPALFDGIILIFLARRQPGKLFRQQKRGQYYCRDQKNESRYMKFFSIFKNHCSCLSIIMM